MFAITVQRSRVGWPWRWWRVRGPNRIWLVQRCSHGSDEQIRRPANDRFDRINHLFYGHWDTLCYSVWVCFQRDRSQHFSRLFKLFSLCTNSEHCNIFFFQIRRLLLPTRHTLEETTTFNLERSSTKIESTLQWLIAPKCLCLFCWLLNLILLIYLPM